MLSVKPVKAKCLFASATHNDLFWLVTALCLLGVALGDKGSVNSWTFDVDLLYDFETNGPQAMVFLSGIQQAVIFGNLEDHNNDIIYVTTMTETNELSDSTVLEGVLEINAAVAHATDDNIVLVAGRAQSGGFTTFDMAFVGALFVEGANKYHWEMFDFVGEKYSTYFQRMTCIEALPRANVFVAAGNSDGAGEGNGMIFAVYDLDDFSKLYTMQHTAKYGSDSSFGSAQPNAMTHIGTDNLVVVNWSDGLCRFKVSRDTMQLKWCRYFTSDYNENFIGIHVVDSSILVTGYKNDGSYNYLPFVRHFDMQGLDQICYLWQYADISVYKYARIHASFYDEVNDTVYLGGFHKIVYDNSYTPLIVAYSASGRHLADVLMFKCPENIDSKFCPESIESIVKSKNGTLMFAMEPKYYSYPDSNVLVTMTRTDCLGSLADDYNWYYDNTVENTALTTEYFGEYTYVEVTDYGYDFDDAQTHWTKTVCGKKPNSATTNAPTTNAPTTNAPTTNAPTNALTNALTNTPTNAPSKNRVNLGTIIGAVVGSLCVCIMCIVFVTGQIYICRSNKHKSGATQSTVTDTEAMVPSTTVAMATVITVPVAAVSDVVDEQRIAELEVGVATAKRMLREAQQTRDSQTATYAPMAASTPGVYTSAYGYGHSED